jgi:tetratricopeptide (TPR) repeat protein
MKFPRILWVVASLLAFGSCTRSPRAYLDRGNQLLDQGKDQEALLNYRKALQADPKLGEAHYRIALVELKNGKTAEAYQDLTAAVELSPDSNEFKTKLGEVAMRAYAADVRRPKRLYEQLTKLSAEFLAGNPNSYEGLLMKGQLAAVDKKFPEAISALQRASQVKPTAPEVTLLLAQCFAQNNQWTEAERLALDLIGSRKEFGPAYDFLFARYRAENRPGDSQRILELKARNNPRVAEYALQLATFDWETGKPAEMQAVVRNLLEHPKDFPKARSPLATFYARIGNREEARRQLQLGIQEEPGESTVYRKRISQLLMAEGKRDQAVEVLEAILKEQPHDDDARKMRAVLLMDGGKPGDLDAALSEFQELVKSYGGEEALHFNYGRALLAKGDLNGAKAEFGRAARLDHRYVLPRLWLAEIAASTQQHKDTLQYANEVLALQPGSVRAIILRAAALTGLGDLQQARAELTRLIRRQPDLNDARIQLGFVSLAEGKFKEADEIFRKLYKPGARDLKALDGLWREQVAQNQYDQAIQLLEGELKANPHAGGARIALASTAVQSGKYDLAIQAYQQLIKDSPKVSAFYLRLGEAYQLKGSLNDAITSYRKARELSPRDPATVTTLAFALDAAGRTNEAILAYRQALNFQSDNPTASNNLAFLLVSTGKNLDEAVQLASLAQRKAPDNPAFTDTLGWTYLKKGMLDNAFQIFSNLVRKYPNIPTFRYHLAAVLFEKGDKARAKEELRNALAEQPSSEEKSKIQELMARLE